ncbi:MAG: ABC transporter ATP-binding protein [Sarcina sp.]
MKFLLKNLKKSILSIIFIIALLAGQAVCDLALPDYTSNIVNVGIQQGGVEDSVPKAIGENSFKRLELFLTENEKKILEESYVLLDKSKLDTEKLDDYLKKYPKINEEKIYELKDITKEKREELNRIASKSIMMVEGLSKVNPEDLMKMLGGNNPSAANIDVENINVEEMISKMPKEQLAVMREQFDEKLKNFPESMMVQAGTSFVKEEYKNLGMNVDNIQNLYILKMGAIMILIALVSMAATVIVGYLGAKVAAKLGMDLRKGIFKKVVGFSNTEMDKFSTASLITRSTNDIQQIQMLMVMLLRVVFYAPILGIGGVIKVLNTDTSMAWIIAVAVMSILSLVIVIFALAMPKFKSLQKLVDKINLVTREILTGILVIRAFNTEKKEEKRFEEANTDLTKTNLFVNRTMVMMMPLMMLIMNLITILIVWNGAHAINDGTMQVGNMMAFIQYTMQIIMSFLMISMVSIILPRAAVSVQRIGEVLSVKEVINDSKNPKKFDDSKKASIEFRNVDFKYPNAEESVLTNLNFTVNRGEVTAFIGGTGSGKSTLINLIPRFYDVTEGEILIDGVNIKEVTQRDLRDKIGYIPQKGILFSGTIDSNLKYGNEKLNEEERENVIDISMAKEFINSKNDRFESEVSEGGSNLSGGQKQRLSIARALAKNAEIYIFDDSFSALDFKTDRALRENLAKNMSDRSLLIVAQRISTIMSADQIIVLDEGRIVGKGNHKELMKNCEVYKQIALSQLSKEELGV